MQIYNEKEQAEQENNVQFKGKNSKNRKYNGTRSSAQRDKKFKEKPDAKWYKWIGEFRLRSCLAKLQLMKRNFLKSL